MKGDEKSHPASMFLVSQEQSPLHANQPVPYRTHRPNHTLPSALLRGTSTPSLLWAPDTSQKANGKIQRLPVATCCFLQIPVIKEKQAVRSKNDRATGGSFSLTDELEGSPSCCFVKWLPFFGERRERGTEGDRDSETDRRTETERQRRRMFNVSVSVLK